MCRIAAMVGAIAVLLVAAAPAAAVRPARVVFQDARDLSIDAKDGTAEARIDVCNVGARVARRLSGEAHGFDIPVVVSKIETRLAPGACAKWSLSVEGVPEGTHAGVLVVTTAGAGVARRGVTIVGEEKSTAKFVAAQDGAKIEARRDGPGDEAEPVGDAAIVYIRNPAPEAPAPNTFLGSLFNAGDRVRVYMDGNPIPRADVIEMPVRFDGADEIGSYSGVLDFTGKGKQTDQSVKASIRVTDHWQWAVGAIVLGALIPLFLLMFIKKYWPRFRLWQRRRRFDGAYDRGIEAFEQHGPPDFEGYERPTPDSVKTHSGKIKDAVKQYGWTTFYWDTSSEAYVAIVKSIKEIEDDIAALEDKGRLWTALDALQEEIDKAAVVVTNSLGAVAEPPLLGRARALLQGRQLDVGGARAWESTALAFTKLVKAWRGHATVVQLYTRWWCWLAELAVSGGMSQRDVDLLNRVLVGLAEARSELLDVSTEGDLEQFGTVRELGLLYERLAYLGAKYDRRPEGDAGLPDVDIAAIYEADTFDEALLAQLTGPENPVIASPGVILDAAAAPAVTRSLRFLGDIGIVAVSAAIGIATGLSTLYFGKDFGTTEDYLTAIVVGSGSAVLLKGLTDNLTAWRTAEAEPKVELSKPAHVSPEPVSGVSLTPPAVLAGDD